MSHVKEIPVCCVFILYLLSAHLLICIDDACRSATPEGLSVKFQSYLCMQGRCQKKTFDRGSVHENVMTRAMPEVNSLPRYLGIFEMPINRNKERK